MRLTGLHETQSIDTFSWGVSDRGASIRVPLSTEKEWKGYVEDRRPASNADPYRITYIIAESIQYAEELSKTLHNMYSEVEISEEVKDMIKTEPIEREVE
jgi:glutamine synthetase